MRYGIKIMQSGRQLFAGHIDGLAVAGSALIDIEAAANAGTPYRVHIEELAEQALPEQKAADLLAAALVNLRAVIRDTPGMAAYAKRQLAEAIKQIADAGKAITVETVERWKCHSCGSTIEIPAAHPRPVVGSRCTGCGAWNNAPGAAKLAATIEELPDDCLPMAALASAGIEAVPLSDVTARRTGAAEDSQGDEHENA